MSSSLSCLKIFVEINSIRRIRLPQLWNVTLRNSAYSNLHVESLQGLQYPCSELVDDTGRESGRGRLDKWPKSVSKGSQTKSSLPKPRSLKTRSNSQDPSSLHRLSTQAKILLGIKTRKLKQPNTHVPNSPDINTDCVIEDLRSRDSQPPLSPPHLACTRSRRLFSFPGAMDEGSDRRTAI